MKFGLKSGEKTKKRSTLLLDRPPSTDQRLFRPSASVIIFFLYLFHALLCEYMIHKFISEFSFRFWMCTIFLFYFYCPFELIIMFFWQNRTCQNPNWTPSYFNFFKIICFRIFVSKAVQITSLFEILVYLYSLSCQVKYIIFTFVAFLLNLSNFVYIFIFLAFCPELWLSNLSLWSQ